MDIKEIKKARISLESNILSLIQEFEDKYDVRVSYISTTRKRPKSTNDGYHPSQCMPEEIYEDQPLEDVSTELRFDI